VTEYRDSHGILIPARAFIPVRYRIKRMHWKWRAPRWLRRAWVNERIVLVALVIASWALGFLTACWSLSNPLRRM